MSRGGEEVNMGGEYTLIILWRGMLLRDVSTGVSLTPLGASGSLRNAVASELPLEGQTPACRGQWFVLFSSL